MRLFIGIEVLKLVVAKQSEKRVVPDE